MPLKLNDVRWLVATEDESGEKVIALSPEDYENMSKNTQAILKVIKDKSEVIKYYRKCIRNFNKKEDQ